MRLLITGSSGQLGTTLQDLLAKYYEIVNKYSQLDYIIDNTNSKLNIKSPFFSYLNEDNIRQ